MTALQRCNTAPFGRQTALTSSGGAHKATGLGGGSDEVMTMMAPGLRRTGLVLSMMSIVAACTSGSQRVRGRVELPSAAYAPHNETLPASYIIGPLDSLQIFVWKNPELTTAVSVRPDGRITTPLIADMPAAGRTPAQLAADITTKLSEYIQNPNVQVIVNSFSGPFSQQVRVLGEAAKPSAIPYRANMTLLDVMIAVGGLTQYAAGNRATLVRTDKGGMQHQYALKIGRLIKDGKAQYNVSIQPGDVIIIPQSLF